MTLADYLRREASRAYQLGAADCVTLVADWVLLRTGMDPMAAYRGDSDRAADVLRNGLLLRVFRAGLRSVGMPVTSNPQPGDVALLRIGDVAAGAILTARGWIVRLDSGMAMPPRFRVIAAWSVS